MDSPLIIFQDSMEQTKLYQGILSKPQVFLIFSHSPEDLKHHFEALVRYYKFTPLFLEDLLKGAHHVVGAAETKEIEHNYSKQYIARTLKKALALNGAKRYLVPDFPQSREVYEEFKRLIGDEAEIRKIILLRKPRSTQIKEGEHNIEEIDEDVKQILKHLIKEGCVIQADLAKPKEQLFSTLKSDMHTDKIYPLAPVEVFFVSGGPGAGKGTQCANLVKDYGFKHLSTGDLLRDAIKNGSKQGLAIEDRIKNGQLVSSDLLVELIKSEIARNNYTGKYLIDGFPRNLQNDEVWTKMMEDDAVVKGLLYMKCGEDTMQKRVLERAKTSGRADDNIDSLKKRFNVYYNETEPIINKYKTRNSVIEINAEDTPQNVYQQIQKELEKINFHPKSKITKQQPGVILVLGGPGSGKGTQCDNLVQHFGFKHLSTGDLLRAEQKQHGLNSELIEDYIKQGKLVPSKILVRLMKKAMIKGGWNGIYLLDGFPRNLQNIQAWQQEIGDEVDIQHCLLFECSEKVMEERLINRGKTSGRIDDNPESIKKRFKTFETQTAPIIALYEQYDTNIKVNAEQQIEKVFHDLRVALIEKGFKPIQ